MRRALTGSVLLESLRDPRGPDAEAEGQSLLRARSLVLGGNERAGGEILSELAAAALDPQVRVRAWAALGELRLRQGRPVEASAALGQVAQAADPLAASWRIRFWHAAALAGAARTDEAVAALIATADAAPAGTPERCMALRWAGWLRASESDAAAARGLWHRALGCAPSAALADSLRLDLAESWFVEGVWDSVRVLLAEVPGDTGGARRDVLLGRAWLEAGQADSARATLERMLQLWPNAPPPLREETLAMLAWEALHRGAYDDALALYGRRERSGVGLALDSRYGEALAHIHAGANETAERTLASSPDLACGHRLYHPWAYALAFARFRLGRYEPALEALQSFAGCAGDDSLGRAAALLRGDCHYRLGQLTAAYAAYTQAAAWPDPPEMLVRRQALAACGAGQWGAAARLFGDLALRYPDTAHAAEYDFWRGEAYAHLGRFDEARRHYLRAQRRGGDDAACAYALAWCDYAQGHSREAPSASAPVAGTAGAPREETPLAAPASSGEGHAPAGAPYEVDLSTADRLFETGQFDAALESYVAFLDRAPAEDARRNEVRYRVARCQESMGRAAEAARGYQALAMLEESPRRSELLLRTGILLLEIGEAGRAVAILERRLAENLDPTAAAITRAYLAQAYAGAEQSAAAQNEWEKVVHAGAAAPDSLRALASLHLGHLAYGSRRWVTALRHFAASDSLGLHAPTHRVAYWAAMSALEAEDDPASIDWFERYLSAGEPDPVWEALARMRLGGCFERAGRGADAAREYERIVSLPAADEGLVAEARRRLALLGADGAHPGGR